MKTTRPRTQLAYSLSAAFCLMLMAGCRLHQPAYRDDVWGQYDYRNPIPAAMSPYETYQQPYRYEDNDAAYQRPVMPTFGTCVSQDVYGRGTGCQ